MRKEPGHQTPRQVQTPGPSTREKRGILAHTRLSADGKVTGASDTDTGVNIGSKDPEKRGILAYFRFFNSFESTLFGELLQLLFIVNYFLILVQ